MTGVAKKTVRCAIYTRVSTDSSLDQHIKDLRLNVADMLAPNFAPNSDRMEFSERIGTTKHHTVPAASRFTPSGQSAALTAFIVPR